jgi:hypothetical protein
MRSVLPTKSIMQVLRPALFLAKGTVKREIEQGISHLYVTSSNTLYIVLRPENQELVAVAVAGTGLYHSRQEIINFAKASGFKTIRFHTRVPDLLSRALNGLNVQLIDVKKSLFRKEYIYRVRL